VVSFVTDQKCLGFASGCHFMGYMTVRALVFAMDRILD
jgi:hypothetical protein